MAILAATRSEDFINSAPVGAYVTSSQRIIAKAHMLSELLTAHYHRRSFPKELDLMLSHLFCYGPDAYHRRIKHHSEALAFATFRDS